MTRIPPIGLIPKSIFERHVKINRYNDICAAIVRYQNANLQINEEWIKELDELTQFLQLNDKKG